MTFEPTLIFAFTGDINAARQDLMEKILFENSLYYRKLPIIHDSDGYRLVRYGLYGPNADQIGIVMYELSKADDYFCNYRHVPEEPHSNVARNRSNEFNTSLCQSPSTSREATCRESTTCPSTSSSNATRSMELTRQIHEEYKKHQVTSFRLTNFMKRVDLLMKKNYVTVTLNYHGLKYKKCVAFGSSATQLMTIDGDFDIAIVVIPEREQDQVKKTALLREMRDYIRNHFGLTHKQVFAIPKAKVPIVKCSSNELEADFVIHYGSTIPPNYLAALSINAYCQIEPKLIQLCFVIKKWAKHFMLQNYSEHEMWSGLPNSYTLVLMCIFMLQQSNILPNLTTIIPELFDMNQATWESVEKVDSIYPLTQMELLNIKEELNHAELSVGGMAMQFFEAYGNLDLSSLIINMKTASIIKKEAPGPSNPLCVIDQYDLHIPSRRVTKPYIFEKLCRNALDVIAASNRDSIYDDLMSMWFGPNHPIGSFLKPKTWKELGYESLEHYIYETGYNPKRRKVKQREQYRNPKL